MKNNLYLPYKLAFKEIRNGSKHFIIFLICLIVGIAVMATINTLGNITDNALKNESQSLLGGDIEIAIRGMNATEEQVKFMKTYGKLSHISTMRAMLNHNDAPTLIEIKAIDDAYPLLGALEINEDIDPKLALASNGAIVDGSLLIHLNLQLGDNIKIGEAIYIIRGTLKREPDRVVHIFNFGPRVMITHDSLAKSGLVSNLSLIEHGYRIITKEQLPAEELKQNLTQELTNRFPHYSWHIKTENDGNLSLKRFLDRFTAFLTLSGLATFLIGGIGIGSAVKAYMQKKVNTIAMLKTMGLSNAIILKTYIIVIAILIIIGGMIGLMICKIIIATLIPVLIKFLPIINERYNFVLSSALLSLCYGTLISYLFSLPSLLSTLNIRPATLFRNHTETLNSNINKAGYFAIFILSSILFIIMIITAKNPLFIISSILMMLITFILFFICSILVKTLAKKFNPKKAWLKLALSNLYRPGSNTNTVIFTIGISLTVLIALTLTEANLKHHIKTIAEKRAPSLFIIDIQPEQEQKLKSLLNDQTNAGRISIYPMIRGRISSINDKDINPENVSEDIRWVLHGDRGISYSDVPPDNANIVQGKWWTQNYYGKPLISVDERFLLGMNARIGDKITLNILGQEIEAKIANARRIDYTTFQINFAMMLSPRVIDEFPHTYIATIYLDKSPEAEIQLIRNINQNFPGITIIRTAEIVEMVKEIMQNIAIALNVIITISLLTGLIVLASALSSIIEQRMYDTAILKILGTRQYEILKICSTEWILLALITAIIAAIIGTVSAFLINYSLKGQDFYIMPEVTITTIISCVIVIWLTGYLGNKQLFQLRPARLLRND